MDVLKETISLSREIEFKKISNFFYIFLVKNENTMCFFFHEDYEKPILVI